MRSARTSFPFSSFLSGHADGASCARTDMSAEGVASASSVSAEASGLIQPSRRRLLGSLAMGAALLPLSACSMFGDDAAEPPPYPVPRLGDEKGMRLLWKNTGGSDALVGFQPAISGNSLWVVDQKGRVRRLSRKDGRVEHEFKAGKAIAGLAVDDELVVLVSRDGTVKGLSPKGEQRWEARLDSEVATAPVLADSAVLVRTIEGRVLALERSGGSTRWSWKAPTALLNLWQSSPMVTDVDTVYVGLPNAKLVALDLRFGVPRWDVAIASSLGATELERLIDIVGAPVLMGTDLCAVAYQGRVACVRTSGRGCG